MKPLHYTLRIEPDLENFTFNGKTIIKIDTEGECDKIILNANDLVFSSCKIKTNEEFVSCDYSFNPEKQEVTIHTPVISGIIELFIEYSGNINNLMAGFYRSAYKLNNETKYIAITQFEETDARRAFPCFDHPSLKATFDIEFVIDTNLTGISNTDILEEKNLGNGKKLVRFERTPPMSTYLVFFGIGEFESIEDKTEHPTIRVVTTKGKTKYGEFGLKLARQSMKFGEEYTNIKFPISKCDYIAVPDFAFGAMENFGAITFRENLLLVYPGVTSKRLKTIIGSVIAHETAHMWFGDIVSPKDWKYIWLNESFASYFNYTIPDHYYPEWHMWDDFLVDEMLEALEGDSLIETMSIELPPDVEATINAASAPIIYNKGASILRMLVNYLSEEQFKKGTTVFLKKYQFDAASSQDYWETLEEVTGKPVKEFAKCWVHQEGYPFISVDKINNDLQIEQNRFTFLPHKDDKLWLIPLKLFLFLKSGETKVQDIVLYEKKTIIKLPQDTASFKLNLSQTGFYRVKYDDTTLSELGNLIKAKKIDPADRFGIENDFYAFVRRGDYKIEDYLNFLNLYFTDEDKYLPLNDIARSLLHAHLIFENKRKHIKEIGLKIFENALQKIGLEPKSDDELQTLNLRDILIWASFLLGSDTVSDFAKIKVNELLSGVKVHEDILSSTLKIAAVTEPEFINYSLNKLEEHNTAETEKILILNALGYVPEKNKLLEILQYNLEKVPNKNKFIMIRSACNNINAINYMWHWFLDNINELEKFHIRHFERVILSVVPIPGIDYADDVKIFFSKYAKKKTAPKDTIKMALEQLEVNLKLRKS
ncbi:MAG: M1 family metallopeptidase [Candidatus Odinarchaeia archaeon]